MKMKEYSVFILKNRDYTEKEISDKLHNKFSDISKIDETINYLKENKFLDDSRYIKNYVNYLIKNKNGYNLIKQKLFKKGFSKILIKTIDSEFIINNYQSLYFDNIQILIKKCKEKYKKYNNFEIRNKSITYLLNKGFIYKNIKKYLKFNYEV